MEKVFHEKSSEEKILPEYFFHLEQIFLGTKYTLTKDLYKSFHWQRHYDPICDYGILFIDMESSDCD